MDAISIQNLRMKYNIYAGLSGGFGGASYQYTTDCDNQDEAEDLAYQQAVEEYESYEGLHGIRGWEEIAEDYCEENNIAREDINEETIDAIYSEEVESWIDYYAVLTDEDDLDPEELDLRRCDDSTSQADSE